MKDPDIIRWGNAPRRVYCSRCRMTFRVAVPDLRAERCYCPECVRKFWHVEVDPPPKKRIVVGVWP